MGGNDPHLDSERVREVVYERPVEIFAIQIQQGTPQNALYGFAGYYTTCLVLNWWFYARKNAEISC